MPELPIGAVKGQTSHCESSPIATEISFWGQKRGPTPYSHAPLLTFCCWNCQFSNVKILVFFLTKNIIPDTSHHVEDDQHPHYI